jgi:hypothetical protein
MTKDRHNSLLTGSLALGLFLVGLPSIAIASTFVHHSKIHRQLAAMGQKRTLGPRNLMSALPPKADIR